MLHFLNQWILPFSETTVWHFLFSNWLSHSPFPLENRSNQRRTTSFCCSKSINLTMSKSSYPACCCVDVMEGAWSYHRPTSLPVLRSYPISLTQDLLPQLLPFFPTWSIGTSSTRSVSSIHRKATICHKLKENLLWSYNLQKLPPFSAYLLSKIPLKSCCIFYFQFLASNFLLNPSI